MAHQQFDTHAAGCNKITHSADVMRFDECNLLTASAAKKRSLLGKDMAMIFQDPMTSLNPCFTVGDQITEVLHTHTKLRGGAAKKGRWS